MKHNIFVEQLRMLERSAWKRKRMENKNKIYNVNKQQKQQHKRKNNTPSPFLCCCFIFLLFLLPNLVGAWQRWTRFFLFEFLLCVSIFSFDTIGMAELDSYPLILCTKYQSNILCGRFSLNFHLHHHHCHYSC